MTRIYQTTVRVTGIPTAVDTSRLPSLRRTTSRTDSTMVIPLWNPLKSLAVNSRKKQAGHSRSCPIWAQKVPDRKIPDSAIWCGYRTYPHRNGPMTYLSPLPAMKITLMLSEWIAIRPVRSSRSNVQSQVNIYSHLILFHRIEVKKIFISIRLVSSTRQTVKWVRFKSLKICLIQVPLSLNPIIKKVLKLAQCIFSVDELHHTVTN